VLDENDAVNYIVTVNETYPKMIGDLQVGYDKDNEFLRQDITLCFRKYSLQYVGMPAPTTAAGTIGQPSTVIPGPQQSIQSLIRNGNRIDRVGPDGTVNGIYDPATAQQLIYGRGVQPTGYPPRNG
jgi:hypothetical protein